jgi:hypothetical protein
LAWFQRGGRKPQEQPTRLDYYLGLGAYDALGIKLREGRIEVKQRQAQHGTVHLSPQFTGAMERWQKWSWALAEADSRLAEDWISWPAWVGVEKKRWLLMVQTTGEDGVRLTLDGESVEQGCQIELAQIRARGQAAWSLSLEGFGGASAGRETLLLAATHLFSEEPIDLPLSVDNSCGYPQWLATLERAGPLSGQGG